jgi:hypothetical protein
MGFSIGYLIDERVNELPLVLQEEPSVVFVFTVLIPNDRYRVPSSGTEAGSTIHSDGVRSRSSRFRRKRKYHDRLEEGFAQNERIEI